MSPKELLQYVIRPALMLLGSRYQSAEAELLLIAIALQESGLQHRVQVGGPARGLWQFEQGGGVKGVLNRRASREAAASLCQTLIYRASPDEVYTALPDNDLLACGFARLLLYTDAKPLPRIGDAAGAWGYYEELWRPGKPRPLAWPANYRAAMEAVE